jgi:hypothetical protein
VAEVDIPLTDRFADIDDSCPAGTPVFSNNSDGGIALSKPIPWPLSRAVGPSLASFLLLFVLLLALPDLVLSQQPVEPYQGNWTALASHDPLIADGGDLVNLAPGGSGLRLGGDPSYQARHNPPFEFLGVYTSPEIPSGAPFDAIRVRAAYASPAGTAVSVDVRVATPSGRWTPWQEVEGDEQEFKLQSAGAAVQYRVTLLAAEMETSPTFFGVEMEVQRADSDTPVVEFQAMSANPTVRVYGTRQGLVGRTTSNGHVITERDRFVALPSRKSLNPKGGSDYQVELSYKGRTATVPVWDVGPWNIRDNYWDSPREMFDDLPRYTPQVNAAFFDNYNDGKDQFGRLILFPAAIDIADGTFWDDLGMTGSDWVDVTFLWVEGAAPPLVPMPRIVSKQGPIPQPIFQHPAATPMPTVPPTPTPIPKTWYFAEGSTSKPFDTWLLLQNPDPEPAVARVTYMLPNGGQHVAEYFLKPSSRTSIFLNSVVPDTEVSTRIESDRYILAERAMYFGNEGTGTVGVISPSTLWYFAEGTTTPPFDTWILLQNPNELPATATLTFFAEDGSTVTHSMLIPHVSRVSLLVNQIVTNSAVGVKVEADRPIVAERAVYSEGGKAGSSSIGTTELSKNWYIAEGNTRQGMETWILMLNPHDVPSIATATFLRETGEPVEQSYLVPARSRVSIFVNPVVPDARIGARIQSDLPIVVERSVYFASGKGAHNTMAAPALSKLWYLPEGATTSPFTQNILLANPNNTPAHVTARFMKEDGSSVERTYAMRPMSRLTLQMNDILPNAAFSTRIQSDQPIVAERSMYFNDWTAGHNSMGIPK